MLTTTNLQSYHTLSTIDYRPQTTDYLPHHWTSSAGNYINNCVTYCSEIDAVIEIDNGA